MHAEQLERLAAQAKEFEGKGALRSARDQWLQALELLPPSSQQAEWIRGHALELLRAAAAAETKQAESKWAKKLGPLAPIAVLLVKGKTLLAAVFKLKFLLSWTAFVGFYWRAYGAKFGVGFALLILIHEMGHFIDVKRRGLPAEMPVFLPGLGAYVQWQALGVSRETRAAVSLAGPLAGWIASAVCALIWMKTGDSLWSALARAGAWLNVLNLMPVWVLDGGQAASALDRSDRLWLLTGCLALWLVLGQSVFFLVAAGATWRLFTKDAPPQPSRATTGYFLAVLALLGLVLRFTPGQAFGYQ